MRACFLLGVIVFLLAGWLAGEGNAYADDRLLCLDAAHKVEKTNRLPKAILQGIALTESGRSAGDRFARYSWPWTVNNAGKGYYLSSKSEAMALVNDLRDRGERNIDVGCMQINLRYHPDAFGDLNSAFDPLQNVQYSAKFLKILRFEHGTWARAIERYHSNDRKRGRDYRRKVRASWRDARVGRVLKQGDLEVAEPKKSQQSARLLSEIRRIVPNMQSRQASGSIQADMSARGVEPSAGKRLKRPGALGDLNGLVLLRGIEIAVGNKNSPDVSRP